MRRRHWVQKTHRRKPLVGRRGIRSQKNEEQIGVDLVIGQTDTIPVDQIVTRGKEGREGREGNSGGPPERSRGSLKGRLGGTTKAWVPLLGCRGQRTRRLDQTGGWWLQGGPRRARLLLGGGDHRQQKPLRVRQIAGAWAADAGDRGVAEGAEAGADSGADGGAQVRAAAGGGEWAGGHAGAERIPHGGDVTVDVPGGEGVPRNPGAEGVSAFGVQMCCGMSGHAAGKPV